MTETYNKKTNNMKKKDYQKPQMEVFVFQLQPKLLAGSNELDGIPGMPDFTPGGNPFDLNP